MDADDYCDSRPSAQVPMERLERECLLVASLAGLLGYHAVRMTTVIDMSTTVPASTDAPADTTELSEAPAKASEHHRTHEHRWRERDME